MESFDKRGLIAILSSLTALGMGINEHFNRAYVDDRITESTSLVTNLVIKDNDELHKEIYRQGLRLDDLFKLLYDQQRGHK